MKENARRATLAAAAVSVAVAGLGFFTVPASADTGILANCQSTGTETYDYSLDDTSTRPEVDVKVTADMRITCVDENDRPINGVLKGTVHVDDAQRMGFSGVGEHRSTIVWDDGTESHVISEPHTDAAVDGDRTAVATSYVTEDSTRFPGAELIVSGTATPGGTTATAVFSRP
ncbi:hypothetical protein ACFQVC_11055 [Streptomyces monticola]|uniref:Uncharacterized protein n=1 Tax=Streptomyces monticola TaxID=2666263 RepID=A0ABW2JFC4_9ACTN